MSALRLSVSTLALSGLVLSALATTGCGDKDGDTSDDGGGDADAIDADDDGFTVDDDCDDNDPAINPFADEYCDGIDNDCDGSIDEPGAVDEPTWYQDLDGDGYGDRESGHEACAEPEAGGPWLNTGGDCDDTEPRVNPGRDEYCDGYDNDCDDLVDEADAVDAEPWYMDEDGDGYGGADSTMACDDPALGDEVWTQESGDCDDTDPSISPGHEEVCNGIDDDCDELVDDEDEDVASSGFSEWFQDWDDDGYGNDDARVEACDAPSGYVDQGGDCDDERGDVHPDADEVCDADDTDEDCDGAADNLDDDTLEDGMGSWYPDNDRDGYGSATAEPLLACDDPTSSGRDYYTEPDDCNDGNYSVHPGASEICNGIDDDCDDDIDDADADTDEDTMTTWYRDEDGDGFGVTDDSTLACDDPSTEDDPWSRQANDCDDDDADVRPTATEVCDDDDTDENCNGTADDEDDTTSSASKTTWYVDGDGDGYGDRATAEATCEGAPDDGRDWVEVERDCDDADPEVHPDAEEICDDIDNDCNGGTRSDGIVTWVASDGSLSDLSSEFMGTSDAPASVSLDSAGELRLCSARYYALVELSADIDVVGYGSVVLDGAHDGTVLSIVDGASEVSITDVDIQNGNGSRADTWIGDDYSNAGGLYCDGASVVLQSVDFSDNQADYGGGVLLEDCEVESSGGSISNSYASQHGGAVLMRNSTWWMEDGNVSGNTGYRGGGGFDLRSGSYLALLDTSITDNETSGSAAAINIDGSEVECEGTSTSSPARITRNESSSASGAAVRGGVSDADRFSADRCDLGEGSNDNAPVDVLWGESEYTFGDDVSIVCEDGACE